MAVTVRLMRKGSKKKPFYRIVATDTRAPRDSRSIELLGTYDPKVPPPNIKINQDRLDYWVQNGSKVSHTVQTLIKTQTKKGS